MFIRVSSDREIKCIDNYSSKYSDDNEKVWIDGKVTGKVESDYSINQANIDDLLDIPNSLIVGDFIALSTKDGKYRTLFTDLRGHREIYYANEGSDLLASDDLYKIVQELEYVSIDVSDIKYFISHGYCRAGNTIFKQVSRVYPSSELSFTGPRPYLESEQFNSVNYDRFKSGLRSTIFHSIEQNKKQIILFSGGVDSTLLLDIIDKISDGVRGVTMEYTPKLNHNQNDVRRAKSIARRLGIEYDKISVDLNNSTYELLTDIVRSNPLSPHISVLFVQLFNKIASSDTQIWCGQNADTLYNLGPTSISPQSIAQRLQLSKPFIQSRKGESKNIFKKVWIDSLIKTIEKIFTEKQTQPPQSVRELRSNFARSTDYDAIGPYNSDYTLPTIDPDSSTYKQLFDEKLSRFYTGGDNNIINYAALNADLEPLLPYSESNMVHMFRNMENTWSDVFIPKRYIRRWARERGVYFRRSHNNIFQKLTNIGNKRPNGGRYLSEWHQTVINKTEFGDIIMNNRLSWLEPKTFQEYIGSFWVYTILNDLPKVDTDVFNYSSR